MPQLAQLVLFDYFTGMKWLTNQEQLVLCAIIGLLLTGLAVKYYLAAHPAVAVVQPANP